MDTRLGTTAKTASRMPDCFKCAYFRITWEPAFPRSCAIFGIKCRNLPSQEVFLSTGAHCPSFLPKEGPK